MYFKNCSLTLIGVLFWSLEAVAAPVTAPPDLSPGESYRLVFTSSISGDGTSSDISVYNTLVETAANAVPELAALSTTWRAIASTVSVDAIDNTSTTGIGVPIYRLDGVKIADNYADLWDSSIDNLMNVDETGAPFSGASGNVFTGTGTNGLASTNEELGTDNPRVGAVWDTGFGWIAAGNAPATTNRPYYGISSVLAIPGIVPVPTLNKGGTVFMLLILAGSAIWMIRRRLLPLRSSGSRQRDFRNL